MAKINNGLITKPDSDYITLPYHYKYKLVPFSGGGNAQSDGVNTLKRMEFVLPASLSTTGGSRRYKFILNPEEYDQTEPGKSTITQTKGGNWVDDFGAGVPTIVFKGTTGFKNGDTNLSGWEKFKELRDIIRNYYYGTTPGTVIKEEMEFHNYTDNEHWYVVPKTFSLKRSISRPLLYCYTISLTCIRSIGVAQRVNENLYITLPQNEVRNNGSITVL